MNNHDYPIGADNSSAPWNKSSKKKEVPVLVSITMSKTFKVSIDEDRELTSSDLEDIVRSQYYLPDDVNAICSLPSVHIPNCVKEDFLNWNIDDSEFIIE